MSDTIVSSFRKLITQMVFENEKAARRIGEAGRREVEEEEI